MFRTFSDSFVLENGVTLWVVEAPSSKRLNRGNHPRTACSPNVNSLRGGKPRGKYKAGHSGGAPWMRQVRKCGSLIKCSNAAFDNGVEVLYSVNDGPQRKTIEENESLKYAQGIV